MHIQCIELLPLYNPRETETTVSSTNFFSGYSWWTNIFFSQGSSCTDGCRCSDICQSTNQREPLSERDSESDDEKRLKRNKGNNKITEQSYKGSQNSYVYRQTKSVNNQKTENRNDPELVQEFLKKWCTKPCSCMSQGSSCTDGCRCSDICQSTNQRNQILKRQTSRFHYGSKFSAVTILEQNR
jgi:hypothetical protein